MDGSIFKVEDINTIIKIFAYGIQERFEEMEGFSSGQKFEHAEECSYYAHKYRSYRTSDSAQVKYIQKLAVRIIQIFDFFKERSKNSHLLTAALKKIQEKLNRLTSVLPLEAGEVFSFVLDLATYGFCVRRSFSRERRQSCNKIQPLPTEQCVGNRNGKQMTQISSTEPIKKPQFSANRKKRSPTVVQKQPIEVALNRVYGILDADTNYLQKIIQNRQRYEKQSLRQNSGCILASRKAYQKEFNRKMVVQKAENPLKQVENRPQQKAVINNWISRKRKLMDCKKRKLDRENISVL